jgi:lysozyme
MNYLEIASEQLRRDEGTRKDSRGRHVVYRCSAGKLTIGWGRNLEDRGISDDEATIMFENDLDEAVNDARRLVPKFDLLSEVRKAVLVNLSFNLGGPKLAEFKKMLKAIDDGRYADAAHEMLDSAWSRQVGERAMRLAKQMALGVKP